MVRVEHYLTIRVQCLTLSRAGRRVAGLGLAPRGAARHARRGAVAEDTRVVEEPRVRDVHVSGTLRKEIDDLLPNQQRQRRTVPHAVPRVDRNSAQTRPNPKVDNPLRVHFGPSQPFSSGRNEGGFADAFYNRVRCWPILGEIKM